MYVISTTFLRGLSTLVSRKNIFYFSLFSTFLFSDGWTNTNIKYALIKSSSNSPSTATHKIYTKKSWGMKKQKEASVLILSFCCPLSSVSLILSPLFVCVCEIELDHFHRTQLAWWRNMRGERSKFSLMLYLCFILHRFFWCIFSFLYTFKENFYARLFLHKNSKQILYLFFFLVIVES